MTVDQNKGITAITYNHLNLPVSISFGTNGTITYLYDASGRKVKKDVQDNITSVNTVVDYLSGGFQYENAQLQFFPHAEGYVNATKTKGGYIYNYVFNYTDHLGNIRLSYTYDEYIGQLKTLEENHYYSFGLKHTNYNSDYRRIVKTLDESGTRTKIPSGSFPTTEYTDYKYKYNGKEYQDELGLNMYDYGARNYDPALGRWMNIDPLAEKYNEFSPYIYSVNNPVMYVDKDGEDPINPQTGKPHKIGLWTAAVIPSSIKNNKSNTDANLLSRIKGLGITSRDRDGFGGSWAQGPRGSSQGFTQDRLSHKLSSGANKQILSEFGITNHYSDLVDIASTPNDKLWTDAANSGSYAFFNTAFAENGIGVDYDNVQAVQVEDNYITKVVDLTRNDSDEFEVSSVKSFSIEKGDVQTRSVKTWWGGTKTEKYRQLSVTQTTQKYKDGKASGKATQSSYKVEEIIE